MRAGDYRGVLDTVHHQRLATGDEQFAPRLRAAIMLQTGARNIDTVLGNLPTTERAFFDAYVENPGGTAQAHNLVYAAVKGGGSNVNLINDTIADLRAHNPTEAGFQAALAKVDADYVRRYGRERGVTSMDQDLQGGVFSELWGSDRKSYRGARTGSPDALNFYNAAEARWLPTHDGDGMMGILEHNIGDPQRLADDYRYVADGGQQGPSPPVTPRPGDDATALQTEGQRRLQATIDYNMTPSEIARAHALMDHADIKPPDERAVDYLNLTMRDYLAGRVTAPGMVQAMRNLMVNPDTRKPTDTTPLQTTELSRLDPNLVNQLAQAKDPAVRGVVSQLRGTHDFVGNDSAVGEVRQMLGEGRDRLGDLQTRLYAMTDDQRAAIRKAIPDFNKQMASLAWTGHHLDQGQYNAVTAALDGRNTDPGSLLDLAASKHARVSDVVSALMRLPPEKRGAFVEQYNR